MDRGVLARFLISLPPDLVGSRNITPELLAEHVLRDYADDVKRLVTDLAGWTDPAMIRLTPGAAKLHTEYRAEIEPRLRRGTGDLETLRDSASKLAGATARIAGLLHLAENGAALGPKTDVSEETMARAITQARYWADHALAAYGELRAHPGQDSARTVLAWIGDRRTFTRRDVQRALHRQFPTAADADAALRVLEEHGYIRLAETARGPGRKTVAYDVHPNIAVTR